jgi:hypothetical protein
MDENFSDAARLRRGFGEAMSSPVSPEWNYIVSDGYQTPSANQAVREALWDETIGEGRRARGLEKGRALLEKARAAMAQEGAAKAAMKAGIKGLGRGAIVGAAQGAAVAPAAAYLGHEASRPRSGGYFTPPEGIRERYQDILSTDEANLISEAIERRKMRERALLEADAIGMAD